MLDNATVLILAPIEAGSITEGGISVATDTELAVAVAGKIGYVTLSMADIVALGYNGWRDLPFNMFVNNGGNRSPDLEQIGSTIIVESTPLGTAYRHMIAEIALPVTSTEFEVDSLIRLHVKRITNGVIDNKDDVFVDYIGAHYQCDRFATLNKSPNFYT